VKQIKVRKRAKIVFIENVIIKMGKSAEFIGFTLSPHYHEKLIFGIKMTERNKILKENLKKKYSPNGTNKI